MGKPEFVDYYKTYLKCLDRVKPWQHHSNYKKMQGEVLEVRNDLLHNVKKLNKDDDGEFLYDLLFRSYDRTASSGRGTLQEKEYDVIVSDSNILCDIEEVIKTPNGMTGEKLRLAIRKRLDEEKKKNPHAKDIGHPNKYLIVNRVIASCTSDVSSTVDRTRFCLLFNFLIRRKIINEYPANRCIAFIKENENGGFYVSWDRKMEVAQWYDENCYLMREIKKVITEIDGNAPDDKQLSTFLWYIWEKELASRYKEKYPGLFNS